MSAQPINFSQYEAQAAKPIDFSGYEAKPAVAKAPPKAEQPGFLDREIPLNSRVDATMSGLQSIGRGVRDAYRGTIDSFDPRVKPGENPLLANPAGRTLRGLYQTGKQALEVPGAIRDINASPDPLGSYAKAAQDTAGEGAGQALTALATEGVGKGIGRGAKAIAENPKAALTAPVRLVARGTESAINQKLIPVRPLANIMTPADEAEATQFKVPGRDYGLSKPPKTTYPGAPLPAKPAPEVLNPSLISKSRTLPGEIPPEVIAPKTNIARASAIPSREGLALPSAPLGAELGDVDTPHGVPAAKSGEALSTVKTPQRLIAKPEAFRSRSIGEQGIPYRAETPAEASMSEDEVRDRLMPHREEFIGKPQELIGVDLSQAPGFSTKAGPNAADWVKFHGDVPESAIRRISSSKPSAIDTSRLGNLLNEGTGGQIPTASRTLEPSVPLKNQLLNSPAKSSLPEGFTATPKSSALQGYKYDPATQHFEVITKTGARHGIQGILPEDFDTFKNSDSLGKAWNQLKKSPGVIKTKNGTPRAIPLEYRSASPDDLTPELEESLKQAKASKGKSE